MRLPPFLASIPWYGWAGFAGLFALGALGGKSAAAATLPGSKAPPTRPPGPPPLLKLGGPTGPWVAYLRTLLGIAPGDTFDLDTKDAVVAFQKAKGLDPDGIVGKNTWGALGVTSSQSPAPSGGSSGSSGGTSAPQPDFLGAAADVLNLPDGLDAREAHILAAVASGQIEHDWYPIEWTQDGHKVSLMVSRRALALADGGERLIVSTTFNTAQKVADTLGAALLTTRVADEIQKQATTKLDPITRPWSQDGTMGKTFRILEQSAKIDQKVGSAGGLVSNEGKDWIITRRNWTTQQGGTNPVETPEGTKSSRHNGANFGWYYGPAASKSPGGMPVIQSVGLAHNRQHADYSQLLRFVNPESLFIDGMRRNWAAALADPAVSHLLQDEGGTLPGARHPDL